MHKYELTINDKSFTITVKQFSSEAAELDVNGKLYKVKVDQIVTTAPGTRPRAITKAPSPASAKAAASASASPAAASGGVGSVTAPIPGLILEIFVKEGDAVEAGKPLLKMEAMKMENLITAPTSGKVGTIRVRNGDTVIQGQELLTIE